ncbi:hypothetical protein FPHYL_7217 [Fusarium phyllophilum]|uniref:Uncharacterized protein n=1 Tax=Fusarium phyllophilum TaxID=47803 RepID=A0A8H5N9V4_9HYPO|nr:hypothetical protein FPHYL_7217 [Fusarium phyllophilum]
MYETPPNLFRMDIWFGRKKLVPEIPNLDLLNRACGGQRCTMMSPSNEQIVIRVEFDIPCCTDSPKAEKEAVFAYLEHTNFFDSWEIIRLYVLEQDGNAHRQFFM